MNELPYLVFAGSASQNLAEKICDSLGCPLGEMRTEHFADGE
ncbi:ribose-phosphate pyrophosphokinase-like domain-containing protein, partial [uncultured Porphyromonas sp.]